MSDLINLLLGVEFLCVELDEDAYLLHKAITKPESLKYYLERDHKFNLFTSLKTKQAFDDCLTDYSVMNSHVFFHCVSLDFIVSALLSSEYRDLNHLIDETLKCTSFYGGVKNEINLIMEQRKSVLDVAC